MTISSAQQQRLKRFKRRVRWGSLKLPEILRYYCRRVSWEGNLSCLMKLARVGRKKAHAVSFLFYPRCSSCPLSWRNPGAACRASKASPWIVSQTSLTLLRPRDIHDIFVRGNFSSEGRMKPATCRAFTFVCRSILAFGASEIRSRERSRPKFRASRIELSRVSESSESVICQSLISLPATKLRVKYLTGTRIKCRNDEFRINISDPRAWPQS